VTSYRVPFRSYRGLLFKFWTLIFELPLEGLATTYAVHLRLVEKLVVDFILVII